MQAHVFQHVPFEGLGSIGSWLHENGYDISVTRWYAGDQPPPPADVDLLIVMGGPMSVNDLDDYPWLEREKAYIRRWVDADRPLLGVCLGGQLIASAMGARIYPNPVKEIGWFPISLVSPLPDHAFSFPAEKKVFHWHGETFDLPPGAIHLARSVGCENQAFQIGKHVIGLQFHLETTPESAAALVTHCRDELIPGPYVQDEKAILVATTDTYHSINGLMIQLLEYITSRSQEPTS